MASDIRVKRSSVPGKVPTNGNLELGELAINTYDGKLFFKKTDGVTENIVTLQEGGGSSGTGTGALQNRYTYTATNGQTTFAASYTSPYIDVRLNGVSLTDGEDFTASNGTSVVLTVPAITGDVITIVGYNSFLALGGMPTGGTPGQVLSKVSGTDYNTTWIDNFATDIRVLVKNSTGGTLTKGMAVYISGANGTNILVSKAQANTESTSSKTFGLLLQDLAANEIGYVVCEGIISGIDTSAATVGDAVWLSASTAGGLVFGVSNIPSAPNHMVYIGVVSRVNANNGSIQVKIQNGYELDELHNVLLTNKVDKDLLVYEASTGIWKNQSASSITLTSSQVTTALGFTPYNSTNPSGYITSSALTGYLTSSTAASTYQAILVSGTNIKTVNGNSILGSGNIQIDGGVTSFNTRTGAITLGSNDVTTALGFTPYNSTNPSGYITSSALTGYLTSSTAASTYQAILVSGTNIKTVNGNSILGSGNIEISGGGGGSGPTPYTATTTDGTATALATITTSDNTAYFLTVKIIAKRTDSSGDYGAWVLRGVAATTSGSPVDIGNLYEEVIVKTDPNLYVEVLSSSSGIQVMVTGVAAKTFNWKATVETISV